MAKLPLTKPIYMAELGRRMGMPAREARRALRRIEHGRKVKLLFKTRRTQRSRLWTTEAILRRFCPEFIDRPKRIEQEARHFVRAMTEKIQELQEDLENLKAANDQGLSELRAEVERLKIKGHG
jgi:hypothetical protein